MATLVTNQPTVQSGTIHAFGGGTPPAGYLLCDGSSVSRATYPLLYLAIGNAYGTADGLHFNIPDLRGRFARGVDPTGINDPDASSRSASNTGGNIGNLVGSLQADQFANHQHSLQIWNDSGVNGGGVMDRQQNSSNGTTNTNGAGGNETRPKNVYVNFMIKF